VDATAPPSPVTVTVASPAAAERGGTGSSACCSHRGPRRHGDGDGGDDEVGRRRTESGDLIDAARVQHARERRLQRRPNGRLRGGDANNGILLAERDGGERDDPLRPRRDDDVLSGRRRLRARRTVDRERHLGGDIAGIGEHDEVAGARRPRPAHEPRLHRGTRAGLGGESGEIGCRDLR
jgi:hypothetical protein